MYYYHNDHLGTPRVLTDNNASVVWSALYTAFGQAQISVETVTNPHRLPGQYYDPETGLHYNYHRYYNPNTGRYLTPDPIGLEGGVNLYGYVGNDPINKKDPSGLFATPCTPGTECIKCDFAALFTESPKKICADPNQCKACVECVAAVVGSLGHNTPPACGEFSPLFLTQMNVFRNIATMGTGMNAVSANSGDVIWCVRCQKE